MGIGDIAIAGTILALAGYLLYRSLWKNKGHCSGSGCSGGECGKK